MEGARREAEYSDVPAISVNECRFLGGWGRDSWLKVWEEVYQYTVKHWKGGHGVRVDLDSLIRAVFPHIAKKDVARETVKQLFLTRLYVYRDSRYTRPGETDK